MTVSNTNKKCYCIIRPLAHTQNAYMLYTYKGVLTRRTIDTLNWYCSIFVKYMQNYSINYIYITYHKKYIFRILLSLSFSSLLQYQTEPSIFCLIPFTSTTTLLHYYKCILHLFIMFNISKTVFFLFQKHYTGMYNVYPLHLSVS